MMNLPAQVEACHLLLILFFSWSVLASLVEVRNLNSNRGNPLVRLETLTKRQNATLADIDSARAIVSSAITKMRTSNKARVQNPQRNIYSLRPITTANIRPNVPAPLVVSPDIAAAAALVAEYA